MRSALPLLLSSFITATAATPIKRGISADVYSNLKFYFQYASSSYHSTCAKPNGNTLVEMVNNNVTDTQGFIARDDARKEVVVAFRGSSDAADFWTDGQIALEPFTAPGTAPPVNTTAHSGFLNAWNSVAAEIISTVKLQLSAHAGYSIVTTGHSLGGALSSLAAITLKQNFPSSPIRMYTYGQPRTGNDQYAFWVNEQFGSNAFRAVHTTDGVPTMLPTSIGYRHHGIEYWQSSDPIPPSPDTTKECAADGEDPTCSASVPSHGINLAHTVYFGILAMTPFCS
ncbi:alpha/beta-hydrolase [Dentipellis sp. KUC8613]|nr:alpha/beta-hydrolase [Dentipellis sp. KUC8613]